MEKVGFIGLGTMGLPMAQNLLKGGYLVSGYDVNKKSVEDLVASGGTAATSPIDAVTDADFVITMLPTGKSVREVLFGEAGVAKTIPKDAVYIDMSTVSPVDTDDFRKCLVSHNVRMVDAPVGRQSVNAEEGTLLIMVGAEETDLERTRPLFNCMGDTIIHCGDPGKGSRMKIVNNYMSIVLNVLTAEALTLAERAGLDLDLAIGVMTGTVAGKGHMSTTYPTKVLQGNVAPGFKIDLAAKHLGLALEFSKTLRSPVVVGAAARHIYSMAQASGRGDDDWTAIFETVKALDESCESVC